MHFKYAFLKSSALCRVCHTSFGHDQWGMLQVICVDNFFTGSKDNVKHLLGKTNFEVIRHDVVEKLMLEVDQIYHLACPASPVHYKWARPPKFYAKSTAYLSAPEVNLAVCLCTAGKAILASRPFALRQYKVGQLSFDCLCRYNTIKTIKTSFLGTMNMLGLAKRTRARFLLTSTSEVSFTCCTTHRLWLLLPALLWNLILDLGDTLLNVRKIIQNVFGLPSISCIDWPQFWPPGTSVLWGQETLSMLLAQL